MKPFIHTIKNRWHGVIFIAATAFLLSLGMFLPAGANGACTVDPEGENLFPDDPAASDYFGNAVAVSGSRAVIGAYYTDASGMNSGAAHVYTRSGDTWVHEAVLSGNDTEQVDFFGRDVDIDADTIVVGARKADDQDLGYNDVGAAYVFVYSGGNWIQQAKLMAADAADSDYFGYSVSIDGDTIVVGAFNDDDNGLNSGSAYVFVRSGETWSQQAKLTATGGAEDDFFGTSVSVSGDRAVVGAYVVDGPGVYISNFGAAYVFQRSGGVWTEVETLKPQDDATNDYFGRFVDIDGDAIIAGAYLDDDNGSKSGSAYIFRYSGGAWVEETKLIASDGADNDYFGYPVAIRGDAVLIGAYQNDETETDGGAAYLFVRDGGVWSQANKILPINVERRDKFGYAVALSDDTAVIGAPYDDPQYRDNGSVSFYAVSGCSSGGGPDPEETDDDGDGYAEVDGDCDDTDPTIHPGAVDICEDNIDSDCDSIDPVCNIVVGDFDSDGFAGIFDAQIVLEITAAKNTAGNAAADVDGDDKIGNTGLIYDLQAQIGLRD